MAEAGNRIRPGGLAEQVDLCPAVTVWAAIAVMAAMLAGANALWPDVGMGPLFIPLIALAGWRLGLAASCLVALGAVLLNIFPLHVNEAGLSAAVLLARSAMRLFTYAFIVIVVRGFRRAYDRARFMATHDAMTGALNKGAFEQRIDDFICGRGTGDALLVATIDLDDFKSINDNHGHVAGDSAICAFAAAARELLPSGECLGRIGGDEFGLLLPVASVEDGRATISLFHQKLKAALGRLRHSPSASIGALIVAADAGLDRLDVMRRVDRAMYEVKVRGKGGMQVATVLAIARVADAEARAA